MSFPTQALADLPAGFASPGPASQVVFRCALQALSHPGRYQRVPAAASATLLPPAGVQPAMAALLLTLLDAEVTLWLSPSLDAPLLRAWLAFHTGVAFSARPEDARFVAARAAELDAALWQRLAPGSDESPQDSATLLVEVDALDRGTAMALSGPGLPAPEPFAAAGIAQPVWLLRQADERAYPLGVDMLLCCRDALAGLPRSTRIALEG